MTDYTFMQVYSKKTIGTCYRRVQCEVIERKRSCRGVQQQRYVGASVTHNCSAVLSVIFGIFIVYDIMSRDTVRYTCHYFGFPSCICTSIANFLKKYIYKKINGLRSVFTKISQNHIRYKIITKYEHAHESRQLGKRTTRRENDTTDFMYIEILFNSKQSNNIVKVKITVIRRYP